MEIKLNMDNLTEQERNTLMGLVEKANKQKVWKPNLYEEYYCAAGTADVAKTGWTNGRVDDRRYAIGNCFRTREEAEFAVEKLKVIAELRRYAEEHNTEAIDWFKRDQPKHYIYYNYMDKKPCVQKSYKYKLSNVYFTEDTLAYSAITDIGADRLKKYYFEVED